MPEMPDLMNTDWIQLYAIPWLTKGFWALAIFLIGKRLARAISGLLQRAMTRAKVDGMLVGFLQHMAYWVMLVAVVLASLDTLGVNITSLLAVVGAAGLAIGLALKDSLSNFAAGVMLIIFRPFTVGDWVEAGGVSGKISEIGMFSTIFITGDNRKIIVPNSSVFGSTITNVNALPTRRIDLVIGVSYSDNVAKARDIIMGVLTADERILKDPAPAVALGELADSSVNFNVRPWVATGDYWAVRADVLERVKLALEAEGLSIPFPQRDVHLIQQQDAA